MFAQAVSRDLDEQGFTVSVLRAVPDAIARLANGDVDVLLTDLQLGDGDGIELLESLRDVSPRTRAVLMSAFASARDYQRALELGAVRVLCKPFTPADLIQCVRQAVDCETGFRGSVHGLSLVDMLQMFNYGRRSVSITVAGESPGRLLMRDGNLVHVQHGARVGEEALRSLLTMAGGTLTTSVLPASYPTSVTREFQHVLLDTLRALDEADHGSSSDDELVLAVEEQPTSPAIEMPAPQVQMLARVRELDGYIAACVAFSGNGGVITFDGSLDLRPAAVFVAEFIRRSERTVADMGLEDEPEDILITATHQYHLVRSLHTDLPAFVHLVLDRRLANPAMAKLALAHAVRSIDL